MRTSTYHRRCARAAGLVCLGLGTLCVAPVAMGQVQLGLKLEHTSALRFEPVHIFITVYNNSGEALDISPEKANLDLRVVVETHARDLIKPSHNEPLCSKIHVPPNGQEMIMREIGGRFDLTDAGRYTIRVEARWRGLVYQSNPVILDVVEGFTIKTVDRHLVGSGSALRRYTLRYWKRNKAEHLFLRVDEPAKYLTYGVFDLGRLIRVEPPKLDVSPDGRVRVVHQLGKDCFKRSIFQSDPAQVSLVDQSYHLPDGTPYPNLRKIRPRIE